MHVQRVVVLLVYLLTVLLSVTVMGKKFSSDKRILGLSGFQPQLRFGRSGTVSIRNDKQGSVKIHPRGDSFFLGPRYGKRSSWSPNASLAYPLPAVDCGVDENLSCTYTGFSDLYRCTSGKTTTNEQFATSN